MSSILDLLGSDVAKQLISGASSQTGQSNDKTANVLGMALPALLGAMKQNASTPQGAQSLNNALKDNRHDGSILNQLGGLLGGDSADSGLLNEGSGILKHVLGEKQPILENNISKTTGMDSSSISQIIKMAAPVLMSVLGSQKIKDNVSESGIGNLLGSAMGKSTNHDQSIIEKLLDANGDGSVLDDVAGMVSGGNNKKGGIGGLLGGLFGK